MLAGISLGILAAFFWSCTNIIDKFLVERYSEEGRLGGLLLLSVFFPLVLLPLVYFMGSDLFSAQPQERFFLFLTGVLMTGFIYFYLKALQVDDVSNVMAIIQLSPVCTLLLSFFLLDEQITILQIGYASLMLSGGIIISYDYNKQKIRTQALKYALLAAFFISLTYVLFKFATPTADTWTALGWRSLGMAGTGLLLMIVIHQYRKDFFSFLRRNKTIGISCNAANEMFTLIGDTLFAFAILLAPVAIIQSTESYQPAFVLLFALALHAYTPNFISEDISRKTLFQKGIGIFCILLGSSLLIFL